MSIAEIAPEDLLAGVDQINTIDQLSILEAMHRRVLEIGNQREAATPLIEGAPEPGLLGGQFARVRRTRMWTTLFYVTDTYGNPMENMATVPLLPLEEFHLMARINELGHSVLQTMSSEEKRGAHFSRLLNRQKT